MTCAGRQTLYEVGSGCDLLTASHFEGDDGLYLVYGHPRVLGGFMERGWCFRQHTTVGFRDFLGEPVLCADRFWATEVVDEMELACLH